MCPQIPVDVTKDRQVLAGAISECRSCTSGQSWAVYWSIRQRWGIRGCMPLPDNGKYPTPSILTLPPCDWDLSRRVVMAMAASNVRARMYRPVTSSNQPAFLGTTHAIVQPVRTRGRNFESRTKPIVRPTDTLQQMKHTRWLSCRPLDVQGFITRGEN